MAQKILVALDRSPAFCQIVFAEALTLVQAFQAEMMLLHVLSLDEESSPQLPISASGPGSYVLMESTVMELYQKRWAEYEQEGLNFLQSFAEKAAAVGITAEFTQIQGRPGRAICGLARNWDADLIVLGRRGRSGISELFLGSVSNYVLHHAPCQVLVVQSKKA